MNLTTNFFGNNESFKYLPYFSVYCLIFYLQYFQEKFLEADSQLAKKKILGFISTEDLSYFSVFLLCFNDCFVQCLHWPPLFIYQHSKETDDIQSSPNNNKIPLSSQVLEVLSSVLMWNFMIILLDLFLADGTTKSTIGPKVPCVTW